MDRTREQMEEIITKHGASVMLNSGSTAVVATTVAQLPSKARLAKRAGDKAEMDAAKDALLARKKAIEDEIQFMDAPPAKGATPGEGQPTALEVEAKAKAQARAVEDMERAKLALELKEKALADERAAFEKAKADHEASLKVVDPKTPKGK